MEAEQVPFPSGDLTGAVVRLPDRDVLVVSVYVEGRNDEALLATMEAIDSQIVKFRTTKRKRTDVVLVGDFNRHDILWGGDDVTQETRRGGADNQAHGGTWVAQLAPKGNKDMEQPDIETTIDLVLTSTELAEDMATCGIYPTEHGSDHRAIRTEFDLTVPERNEAERFLFKNAPWSAIRARVEEELQPLPWEGGVRHRQTG